MEEKQMFIRLLASAAVLTAISCILALTAWLVLGNVVLASEREQPKTISFGSAELHLGMTPEEARAALAKDFTAGSEMESDPAQPELESWLIRAKDSTGGQVGGFTVKNNHLISAYRVVARYPEETVPAGQVISDLAKALQQLSKQEWGQTKCSWKRGNEDSTRFAWDVANGRLELTYCDGLNGSRATELTYVIRSDENR